MNSNIYHKTVLLHACSYMIHPQVLLGPHHRRMPICLGKEKVKLWAQKTQCDPRNGVSKVQYVHFILRCEFDYGGKSQIMIKQSH